MVRVVVLIVERAFAVASALVPSILLSVIYALVPFVLIFLSVAVGCGGVLCFAVSHVAMRAVSIMAILMAVRAVVYVRMPLAAVIHGLVVRAVASLVHSAVIVPTGSLSRYQFHAADGAGARLTPDDLGMHGADVLGLDADHVYVEVGRLPRKGTLREEPP